MCGIVGQIGPRPVDLGPALEAIRHRGPDDRGVYGGRAGDGTVGLGFVRLAILDLSPSGHQPMTNEDESVWMVFNGEIYNYRALREELAALGHRFHSTSDSETVLHGYEQWGDGVLHRLRGMFALALWDARRERLLAARDRLGIKPFFWSDHGGRLLFGSEMKALLALGVPREMDADALAGYLRYLYVPRPRTIFSAIRSLEPGHQLTWQAGRTDVRRYWDLGRPAETRHVPTVVEELRALLDDVVKLHLASDVPLGAFLSGGVDSSTLVALMARHSSAPVRTFCMTFGEGEGLYDEREFARTVAARFGTIHTEIPVKPDLVELLPQVVRHFDEPFGNPTALLVYLLSKETRKHVTVALAGDGGDEVFLGYPRYQGARLAQHYRLVPPPVRRWLGRALAPLIRESTRGRHSLRRAREFISSGGAALEDMYEDWIGYYTPAEIRLLLAADRRAPSDGGTEPSPVSRLFAASPAAEFLDRVTYVDLKSFLPNNLLHYTDRMSMAHALEVRVPFCDHRLVELMAAVSFSQKMRRLSPKYLLKQAVADLLPAETLGRKKLGFNPPMGIWLNRDLAALLDEHLDPARLRREGTFDAGFVRRMVSEHRAGRRDFSLHLWALLVFQTWLSIYGT